MAAQRRLRIGELARRTGVSADGLRAWEKRYGLLQPSRSDGGYRLYSPADEERVRAMVRQLEAGVPAAEAARLVLEEGEVEEARDFSGAAADLRGALDGFDDGRAQAALDALLTGYSFETIAREVLLPYLRGVGDRWEWGETSVAQEHFASIVLRGRLLALARGWDRGGGPRALLACAPGELHELGLILFGLALRGQGWRITYLGADTPLETLAGATRALSPDAVVIAALAPERLQQIPSELAELARETRLFLAGSGARPELAEATGSALLEGDPVEAAGELAGRVPAPRR
jgi:MerR family transcriptional regulator, light-induced transcriptional regulator